VILLEISHLVKKSTWQKSTRIQEIADSADKDADFIFTIGRRAVARQSHRAVATGRSY
jgi:hypothetical protein